MKTNLYNAGIILILMEIHINKIKNIILLSDDIIDLLIKYNLNTAKNEIPYQSLDYQRIKTSLNWKPTYRFSMVLNKIFSWYKKYFKNAQ